jgi:hypothetical protein
MRNPKTPLKAQRAAVMRRPRDLAPAGSVMSKAPAPSAMNVLMDAFGAAVATSRLRRRRVRFVVDVGPGGKPKIGPIEETSLKETEPPIAAGDSALGTALDAARERGRARVTEILSGEDMLSAEKFAALIGTSRVTVNAKRQNRQLLGLDGAKRGFRFPRWQIDEDGKPFAALPALFDRLGGSPWAVYRFLVQHHPELDGLTGREALSRGRAAEAIEVAESVVRAAS